MNASQVPAGSASRSAADLPVRKTIVVAAPLKRAFQVFTEEIGSWWPLASYHIGKADAQTAVMEPFAGGRWFERGVDGSECDWGHVRIWDPPHRLVLSWEISSGWQHDPSIRTEIEVDFISEGASTRVELEHRLLHYYGDKADEMRGAFDSPQGWALLLESFARRVSAS